MNAPRRSLLALFAAPALALAPAFVASSARADEGGPLRLSAGPALGRLDSRAGDADLAGFTGSLQLPVGSLLGFDLSLRGSYTYLVSTDSTDLERQDADLDLVFSTSVLGFLNPFATVGVSYDRFDALAYSGDADWDPGLAAGIGVKLTLLPGLLHLTPAVRYVDADSTDSVTALLDAQLTFTALSVGAVVAYEDNRSRDGELVTAALYAALSF
jgi:hypothetical protein